MIGLANQREGGNIKETASKMKCFKQILEQEFAKTPEREKNKVLNHVEILWVHQRERIQSKKSTILSLFTVDQFGRILSFQRAAL